MIKNILITVSSGLIGGEVVEFLASKEIIFMVLIII